MNYFVRDWKKCNDDKVGNVKYIIRCIKELLKFLFELKCGNIPNANNK